jgi:hypothetical protein
VPRLGTGFVEKEITVNFNREETRRRAYVLSTGSYHLSSVPPVVAAVYFDLDGIAVIQAESSSQMTVAHDLQPGQRS